MLSAIAPAGYDIKSNQDGTQLFIDFQTTDNPAAGDENWQSKSNIGPHTITISDGTVYNLTYKQARTRFRHPRLTSKVVHTPKWLVDNHFMFPFGDPGATLATPPPAVYDGPNSFAGMTRYMGQTGERPELGLVTEWAAKYMQDGDPTALLNVAEAAGTAPMFYIDIATGKPVSKLTYVKANNYGGGAGYRGGPWLMPAPADFAKDPNVIYPSGSHLSELSYHAAMITEDPWHVENLQAWCGAILFGADSDGVNPPVLADTETRAMAGELRTLAMAEVATKYFESIGKLPVTCLPSSYYATLLDVCLKQYILGRIADPDKQVFRVFEIDANGAMAPWQCDKQLSALAFLVLTGHTGWNAPYLWYLKNAVDRTSGKSGWAVCLCSPYYISLHDRASWKNGWADAMKDFLANYVGQLISLADEEALLADQFNEGRFLPQEDGDYPMQTQGCLAEGMYLHQIGKLDVLSTHPDLPTCYANTRRMFVNKEADVAPIYGHGNWFFNNRDAITFDPLAFPPNVIIQPTPVGTPAPVIDPPPPGPGVPPMSALEALDTAVATVKADAAAILTAAGNEVKAVHDKIAALAAAAAGTGTQVDPVDLQAQVSALNEAHQKFVAATAALTADTAALA